MKEMYLSVYDATIIVDDEDHESLSAYTWSLDRHGYAKRVKLKHEDWNTTNIFMHRQILGLIDSSKDIIVDHINQNIKDNRKANLRQTNKAGNSMNRSKASGTYHSGYKGVTWQKSINKWQAQIKKAGKNRVLGYFVDEIEAAKEYDKAAKMLFGEMARPNFEEGI